MLRLYVRPLKERGVPEFCGTPQSEAKSLFVSYPPVIDSGPRSAAALSLSGVNPERAIRSPHYVARTSALLFNQWSLPVTRSLPVVLDMPNLFRAKHV